VSIFAANFSYFLPISPSFISAPTFVDIQSTAHLAVLRCSVSPVDWQNSFVEFEVSTFFFFFSSQMSYSQLEELY